MRDLNSRTSRDQVMDMDEDSKRQTEPLRVAEVPGGWKTDYLLEETQNANPHGWSPAELRRDRKFNERFPARRPVVTVALLGVAVFVATVAGGISMAHPAADDFLRWGANYGPLTTHGEWWRLVTSIFLDLKVVRLLVNMLCFLGIAGLAERIFGRMRFAALYVLAGAGGNLASLYANPLRVGMGATGAVLGIYGGMLAFVLLQLDMVPRHRIKSLAIRTVLLVGLMLGLNGLTNFFTGDAAMEAGGFATGLLVGGALTGALLPASRGLRMAMNVAIFAVVAAIALIASYRAPTVDDYRAEMQRFLQVEEPLVKLFSGEWLKLRKGEVGQEEFARVVDRQVLPPWNAERERMSRMKFPGDQRAIADKVAKYMSLREEGWVLAEKGILTHNRDLMETAAAKQMAAREIVAEMRSSVIAVAK